MGPLEIIYGWQALLCAAACYGLTQLVVTVIDLKMTVEKRKANLWLNRVVLPIVPVVLGGLYALVVPLRPDVVVGYVEAHLDGFWTHAAYAGWGAACGQFSTFLYQKLMDFIKQARARS